MADLEKIKRYVLRNNNTAKLCIDKNGLFYIADQNGNLFTEYFIPHTPKAFNAWKTAKEIIELNKNLRRTHPLKSVFYEDAADRINGRKKL